MVPFRAFAGFAVSGTAPNGTLVATAFMVAGTLFLFIAAF
jgi:hypothetical protein